MRIWHDLVVKLSEERPHVMTTPNAEISISTAERIAETVRKKGQPYPTEAS
ncbi:hypothetical protein H634G_11595 [Metarhizium anisopliae BRIP 53293]|uniref:Uncharacterized protein n=1 Tax=Metarhizium anisopliae BRIP 53293 TaxID=1291518 RepID=A0A0D9NH25_METAN|nr:hypothetical protein H634G_11595 [Metarhizium anisopliae BRIP 53293]